MSAITAKASRKMKKYAVLTREPRCFLGSLDFSWEQRKLGEIGSVSMCRRIFKEQTSETGDIPFYKIGTFGAEPDAFISRELFEEYKSKYPYPKKGDILISASGSIGRTVEFAGNNEYFQDSNIVWLSHDERLSNSFLKCFYSVVKWAGIEGSTIKRLYNDNILNTVICMPSVPEQEHIGLFFENLDNLITLHQRKCALLFSPFQALISMMFTTSTFSWEQRKLGDIADIVGGGTPSTGNQSYWDGDIDWYAPAEIADQIYVNSSQKKITGLGYENSSAKILPPGTVLFTSRAGIGKTAILTRKGCTNQGFQSIVPYRGELDSYFIFSRTEELKRYGELVGAGSTFVEVSGKQMAVMELMMPPTMREQQTIGGFFQQLDHLITLHQRKCISFTGRAGRLISTVNKKRITSSWEQRKFSELVQIERGGSPRPIDDFITDAPNGLNWIKIGDAPTQGNYITKTAEKIRPEGLSKTREVHPGDLILSNSMSFGKPYIMGIDGCIHDGWLLIRNTYGVFDLTFLCHLLGTPQMLSQYRSLAAGSTVNNLNKELVGNTVVTIPSITEQRVLGDYLEQLDNLITLHQRKPFLMKWRNSDANRNQTNRLVL